MASGPDRAVFIGGTGRCGTTLLRRCLALHPHVAAVPMELRLLIDPGGLLDLARDVSKAWTPWRADAALVRFQELIAHMCTPGTRPYRRYDLSAVLGQEAIQDALQYLVNEMMTGVSEQCFWTGTTPRRRTSFYETRWYEDTRRLAQVVRGFMRRLYSQVNPEAELWLDDTPDNLQFADELCAGFNGQLIHIYRHPYDVLASLKVRRTKTRRWPGETVEANARRLEQLLRRWDRLCGRVSEAVLEISLERLVKGTGGELEDCCEFMGLDPSLLPWDELPIDPEKANMKRYVEDLTDEEFAVAQRYLRPWAEARGYPG